MALVLQSGWMLLAAVLATVALAVAMGRARLFGVVVAIADWADRRRVLRERKRRIALLSETHRRELSRLDDLLDGIRAAVPQTSIDVDGLLGLDRLTNRYLEIALAHQRAEEAVEGTRRDALDGSLRSLTTTRKNCSEPARRLVDRRIAIVELRIACHERARARLDVLRHQLTIVVELAELMRQRCASAEPSEAYEDIDLFLQEVDEDQFIVRELAETGAIDAAAVSPLAEIDRGERSGFETAYVASEA